MASTNLQLWSALGTLSTSLISSFRPQPAPQIQFSPQIPPLKFESDWTIKDQLKLLNCTGEVQADLSRIFTDAVNDLEDKINSRYANSLKELAASLQGNNCQATFDLYSTALSTRTLRDYNTAVKSMIASILAEVERRQSNLTASQRGEGQMKVERRVKGQIGQESLDLLELAWTKKHHVSTMEKRALATAAGLEPKQVGVWFANQRQRRGKESRVEPYPARTTRLVEGIIQRPSRDAARPPILPPKIPKYNDRSVRVVWNENEADEEDEEEEEWEDEEMDVIIEETLAPIGLTYSPPACLSPLTSHCDSPPATPYESELPQYWSTLIANEDGAQRDVRSAAISQFQSHLDRQSTSALFDLSLPAYASSAYNSPVTSSLSEYDPDYDFQGPALSIESDQPLSERIPQFVMPTWPADPTTPTASNFIRRPRRDLQHYSSYDDLSQEQRDMMIGMGEDASWSRIMGRAGLAQESSFTLAMEVDQ